MGQYSTRVFEDYRQLVALLVSRRKQIGLSQEEVGAASGLADGHINKLEAFDRVARLPTLQLWAQTIGLQVNLAPCPMPDATLAAIERRVAPLREPKQMRLLTDDR